MGASTAEALEEATLEEVLEAGRTLFGPAFGSAAPGWRAALRATYRRRALETHPDRARALGRGEAELAREFRAVADAYRVLSTLRGWPASPVARAAARARTSAQAPAASPRAAPRSTPGSTPHAAPHAAPHTRRTREAAPHEPAAAHARRAAPEPVRSRAASSARAAPAHVRVGVDTGVSPQAMPARRLKLAEYLYYAGCVPWSAFVEAIAWQRAQRPPLGRVAVDFGFLAPEDVRDILERRRAEGATAVPFGEYAVAAGYLTPFQLLASLGKQLRLQRRIGAFFVERGLLAAEDLEEARRRLARHNARH